MIITVYDLETTGLNIQTAEPVQAALVTVDVNPQTKAITLAGAQTLYFYRPDMPWSSEAEATHGISREFLKKYEYCYLDNVTRLYAKLNKGCVCGFNNIYYDDALINSYYKRLGLPAPDICQSYDMMRGLAAYMHKARFKLTVGIETLGLQQQVDAMMKNIFPLKAGQAQAHDATYDTVATLCLFNFALQNNLILLE